MSFTARYAGLCKECGETFLAGEQVRPSGAGYAHAVCATDRKPAPVCISCFIEKPCACDDERRTA